MKKGENIELYDLTPSEAMGYAINKVAEELEVSKKDATIYVKNALVYNCVIAEIVGQCRFLAGMDFDD